MKLEKNIFNMNTNSDKIDSYLLNKMSDEDKAIFEKELSSNADLREDLEFTSLVRDEIKDRNEKIRFIKSVKAKRSRTIKLAFSITSIAAAIVLGLFIITPDSVSPEIDMDYYTSYRATGDIAKIAELINEEKFKEALASIELEQSQINDEFKIIMESSSESVNSERIEYETQLVENDLYELSWLRANALIGLKEYHKATEVLEQLLTKNGSHQKEAEELLKKLK